MKIHPKYGTCFSTQNEYCLHSARFNIPHHLFTSILQKKKASKFIIFFEMQENIHMYKFPNHSDWPNFWSNLAKITPFFQIFLNLSQVWAKFWKKFEPTGNFKIGPIHIPTFQAKGTHSYTGLPNFWSNLAQNYPFFQFFLNLSQVWVKFKKKKEKLTLSYTLKIKGHWNIISLILLFMLTVYHNPSRASCPNYPRPGHSYQLQRQLTLNIEF